MIYYMDSNVFKHQDEWFEQALNIQRYLPSECNLFGEWGIRQTHNSLRFQNVYFVREFTGKPRDEVLFTLILSKDPEIDFKIQFNNQHSRYLASKYHIRSYLEGEITDSLLQMASLYEYVIQTSLLIELK